MKAKLKLLMLVAVMMGPSCGAQQAKRDEARLRKITGAGSSEDGIHVLHQRIKLTRRDVQLLRSDRRLARAAYPDVRVDELYESRWFAFDEADRVPTDGHWNAHATQDRKTGQWYLDAAYVGVVRAKYPKRASVAEADTFFVELAKKERSEKLRWLKTDGYMAWTSNAGDGPSFRIRCMPDKECVVERAEEWADKATRWVFPFVVEEFLDCDCHSLDAIKKLPSFAKAIASEFNITPRGTSMVMESTPRP